MKRVHKARSKGRPRVPVPPPTETMRDRRQRRPGNRAQQIQAELDELQADIDEALRNQNG